MVNESANLLATNLGEGVNGVGGFRASATAANGFEYTHGGGARGGVSL